jgi:ribose 1,5-bisphosphate isomerase
MSGEEIRNLIPKQCLEEFDGIVSGRILGASRHIKMIFGMIKAMTLENKDSSELRRNIQKVIQYFKDTRGQSSYAVVNALNQMEAMSAESGCSTYPESIRNSINSYFSEEEKKLQRILKYSRNVLKSCTTVMVYDYSSTVEKAIVNSGRKLNVIIPESRVINGGCPFVRPFLNAGHKIQFIPDAAMLTVLDKCDAVFIGAETFYPDGTAFNTCGSDILAELCHMHRVPYYVITPLLKIDPRAQFGIYKKQIIHDMKSVMADGWEDALSQDVDFRIVELTQIDPDLITFYITEEGIIRPSGISGLVLEETDHAR